MYRRVGIGEEVTTRERDSSIYVLTFKSTPSASGKCLAKTPKASSGRINPSVMGVSHSMIRDETAKSNAYIAGRGRSSTQLILALFFEPEDVLDPGHSIYPCSIPISDDQSPGLSQLVLCPSPSPNLPPVITASPLPMPYPPTSLLVADITPKTTSSTKPVLQSILRRTSPNAMCQHHLRNTWSPTQRSENAPLFPHGLHTSFLCVCPSERRGIDKKGCVRTSYVSSTGTDRKRATPFPSPSASSDTVFELPVYASLSGVTD